MKEGSREAEQEEISFHLIQFNTTETHNHLIDDRNMIIITFTAPPDRFAFHKCC